VGVEHPELGLLELIGPLWRMSACQTPRRHAPLLGQHNRYVLGGILGLSDEEIARLADEDVILKT
jgi:crotonobetainyl-CoA:carnitine CoA-transferase CaiB-like acyl-CoA transferase